MLILPIADFRTLLFAVMASKSATLVSLELNSLEITCNEKPIGE